WEGLVTFANGAVPMAVLPDSQQCVVREGETCSVAAHLLLCDGTMRPAGELALSTNVPARVAIDGHTVRVLTPGWATVTVKDVATGLAADMRVGRYPATLGSLPPLGRHWSGQHAVDADSRAVVAPSCQ